MRWYFPASRAPFFASGANLAHRESFKHKTFSTKLLRLQKSVFGSFKLQALQVGPLKVEPLKLKEPASSRWVIWGW